MTAEYGERHDFADLLIESAADLATLLPDDDSGQLAIGRNGEGDGVADSDGLVDGRAKA